MTDPGRRRFVPIAITGFSGVFPGVGDDQAAFRKMLRDGRTAAAPVPDTRWSLSPDEACGADPGATKPGAPDVAAGRVACLLPEMDYEANGFAPGVAALLPGLDPVLRLSLHAGARAWRGSATSANANPERTGVVLAAIALPTEATAALTDRLDGVAENAGPLTAADGWNARVVGAPAAIVAAGLGLGGGAFTLDAACASSLYALRFACDELAEGRADAMLAGGVSRPDSLYTQMGFSQLRALSPTGRCAPFGDSADGLVVGEGAGVAVLRRLSDAVAAGEPVLAVIRGIGLSNDTAGSLLSPDSEGQSRAMAEAYAMAGWKPADVDFVECHGTGTPTGDAVEIASLAALFAGDGAHRQVPVGSVKSNVGHLLTAAGMAALGKTLGAMAEGVIPPTANVAAPAAALAGTALSLPLEATPWPRRPGDGDGQARDKGTGAAVPRRAAVSGFGFGGINAHLLLEEWIPGAAGDAAGEAALDRPSADATDAPVAIVGMSVRVGPVADLRAFQELVLRGESAVSPRPADRWSSLPAGPGADAMSAACGAWMPAVEVEVGRFKIPPAEIDCVLPRQLLALMVTDEALADAAGPGQPHRATGVSPRTGVYFGAAYDHRASDFHRRWRIGADDHPAAADLAAARDAASPALDAPRVVGALGNMVASRVAKEFGFGGPSFELSSGPSSALRALSLAAGALRRGEIDSAVVGAVDLCGDARAMAAAAALRPASPGRAARPFDEHADGAVTGEGAAAIVVKRLSDARRDGDRVYAVLRGEAHATGDLADGGEALSRAMDAALARSGGQTPGLVECHGSGAPADDSEEAAAISSLGSAGAATGRPVAVGSVAPSVGTVGAAAGLVSLVKAALCLHTEMLPPLANFSSPRADAGWDADGIFSPRFAQYWFRDRADGPRRAGVSSLGTDGTAAFAVMEGDDDSASHARRHDVAAERAQPLGARDVAVFAARGANAVRVAAELRRLAAFALSAGNGTGAGARAGTNGIEALARAWHRDSGVASDGRSELCAAVVARDAAGLARTATAAAEGIASDPTAALTGQGGVWFSPAPLGAPVGGGAVAFVFPGSGNHYLGMGRGVSAWWPEVLRALDRENLHLASQTMARWYLPQRLDWRAGWETDAARAIADDPQRMIFGQVAYGTVVSDLLRALGVEPSAVIGYSLGESTGLFALRAWRDRDGMLQRMLASPLFRTELAGPCHAAARAWGLLEEGDGGGGAVAVDWRVAVVNRPSADVRRAVAEAAATGSRRVYHLIANTPDECVIGGDAAEVRALIRALGCDAFVIEGVPTVHCDVVREVEYAYQELHRLETTPPAGVRFYSVAKARAHHLTREAAAGSILAQAQKGFDFPATIERAYEDGVRVFVEPGPQGSCTRMIGKILAGRPHVAVSACLAGEDDNATLAKLMAAMLAERVVPDLAGLYGHASLAVGHRTMPAPGTTAKAVVTVPLDTRRVVTPATTPKSHAADLTQHDTSPPLPPVRPTVSPEPSSPPIFPPPSFGATTPDEWRGGDVHPDRHAGTDGGLFATVAVTAAADIAAHDTYLAFATSALADFGSGLALQARLMELTGHAPAGAALMEPPAVVESDIVARQTIPAVAPVVAPPAIPAVPVAFTRDQCLKFARGSLAEVFGPAFARADAQPTRTRLPEPPLMLCDRVLTITGEPGSMSRGTVVTEHDVLPGAWYLDGGRAPVCISVEAGQADMFLAAWLGVDLHTAGLRMYRLLDADVTFHRDLPPAGSTLRYEIALDRFVTQGDTHLFFFRFEGFVDGEPLLTMTDGTAGYFTHEEVENSGGILDARTGPSPAVARPAGAPAPFVAIAEGESLGADRLTALRAGDLGAAFSRDFSALPLADPVRLPGGPMTLVHRIAAIHPSGGRAGLGFIRGEADIRPDDWFLTCHFFDDMVMPGTLMFECCAHVLRVFLMRMGWVGEQASAALPNGCAWQPVPGAGARLKCRGPVTPDTRLVTYEIEVTELGFGPEPYAIADALMLADGRPVVKIDGMSLRLTGQSREGLEALWAGRAADATTSAPEPTPLGGGIVPTRSKSALFGPDRILAYSNGLPSEAFGDRYLPFDTDRRIARLPGPPYQFLDRVTEIHTAPWELKAGGWIECQWDVPADAWHFRANRQRAMSFAILLEAALQPCGWMAAYVGSALRGAEDLSFRNLGGTATLFIEPTAGIGTLTTRTRLDKVSEAGGMIIQEFSIQAWSGSRIVYDGVTSFGFFTAAALATQVGVRDAAKRRHAPNAAELARAVPAAIADVAPLTPDDPATDAGLPSALPARALRMVDDVELFVPDGGPRGLGYLRGTKAVEAGEWFFAAHFYQDPVVPGSLGLEAFLQLMKVAALHRWPGLAATHQFEPIALGVPHTWVYRGQVIPRNRMVTVEVSITAIDDSGHLLMANGFLVVDGLPIYEMKDFGLRMVPA